MKAEIIDEEVSVQTHTRPAEPDQERTSGMLLFTQLWQDIRHGIRLLRKNPGFVTAAVLTLALGIGANSVIFSVLYGILLRPLPYSNPTTIVRIWQAAHAAGNDQLGMTEGQFVTLRKENECFSNLGVYTYQNSIISKSDESERVASIAASSGVLESLGVRPILGHGFRLEDETSGTAPTAILTYKLWQSWFQGSRTVIGKTLRVDDRLFTIIGVLPANFIMPEDYTGPNVAQLWIPLRVNTATPNWTSWNLSPVARLSPGVSPARALAEVRATFIRLWGEHPIGTASLKDFGWDVRIINARDDILAPVKTGIWILAGAVAIVLVIVCANIASLLLARAIARQREFAVRIALGAKSQRIIRQLLTESMIMSYLGGIVGLGLAALGLKLVLSLGADNVPRLSEVTLNLPVIFFTLGICLISAILFGLFPAIQSARPNLNRTLREEGRGTSAGATKGRIQRTLVVAEVACAVILVIGAGLLLRSYRGLAQIEPGFTPENLLSTRVSLPPTRYTDAARESAFNLQLLDRVRALPGVTSAAITSTPPLIGESSDTVFGIEGQGSELNIKQHVYFWQVSSDFLRTTRAGLLAGRPIEDSDVSSSPLVAVINEAMAKRYWPNQDPVGKRITLYWTTTQKSPWIKIVGVVKYVAMRQLNEEQISQAYIPMTQSGLDFPGTFNTYLLTRSTKDPERLTAAIRAQIHSLDSAVPISHPTTGEELVAGTVSQPHFNLVLLSMFAGLALILAAIGVYGILSNVVRQRSREIGIRISLGANQGDVFRLVIGQGMKLVGAGLVIGLIGALGATRLLTSLLFGVKSTDPTTFCLVLVVLSFVGFLASYLPARRAMAVDPMITLRSE